MSQPEKVLVIADSITVGDLAGTLNLPVTQLVGELFKNGIVATINQRIDFETAQIIVEELGIDVELTRKEGDNQSSLRKHELTADAVERAPIVAVMGHVDHGKTSLLDAILGMKAADGEAAQCGRTDRIDREGLRQVVGRHWLEMAAVRWERTCRLAQAPGLPASVSVTSAR